MSGPGVTQIDHVSVLITDVERSRRFYGELLGLREIAKPKTFDFVVLWFDLGNQQLHLLLKKDVESTTHERRSLMPVYTKEMLSDTELEDVVAFLESLRGNP